jgi:Cu-Zn family superoxide dismutase
MTRRPLIDPLRTTLLAALAVAAFVLAAPSLRPAAAQPDPAASGKAAKPAAKKPVAGQHAAKPAAPSLIPPPPVKSAVAHLQPTAGSKVKGTVEFAKETKGIKITANVSGLAPGSSHGFHIHTFGDCSAADGSSAGGHFSSQGAMHSGPGAKRGKRHEGDLGNLVADADGNAKYERVDMMIALEGRKSILGRAVIVHADADDLETQPTGNAGARLACGVIGVTE